VVWKNWTRAEIAVITGHQSVDSLVRYINVCKPEVFERFHQAWG
jgi:hypothetical protein